MQLSIEINIQEMNRLLEGLDYRRVQLRAGVEGRGNMVPSRSTEDYIALNKRSLASLETVHEKLQNAANDADLYAKV
jgi:hypothetical protein